MLHHVSFNVRDPQNVAHILAGMSNGKPVRAPSPPFPTGSWFVCAGDTSGSFLEILPWGNVFDPDARFGVRQIEEMPERSGAHVLVSTPYAADVIQAAATREGWRSEVVDARLFKVVKVWIENTILIEFLPPEMAPDYVATFGTDGNSSLDAKLRRLEAPAG